MFNPLICLQDNFFDDFTGVKKAITSLEFKDEVASDSVTYPYIAKDIPDSIRYEFLYKLERLLGARVDVQTLFARAMPEDVAAPNAIHSDKEMGAFTAHVYILAPGETSTTFYSHKEFGPQPAAHQTATDWDSRDFKAFTPTCTVHGRKNRLLVHHAAPFHCAHPTIGIGKTIDTCRIVLTCFFNVI